MGLKRVSSDCGVLLRTSSVHTAGMVGAIDAIGLDGSGTVRWVRTLYPASLVRDRAVSWIAELPVGGSRPHRGCRLRAVPILGRWPEP